MVRPQYPYQWECVHVCNVVIGITCLPLYTPPHTHTHIYIYSLHTRWCECPALHAWCAQSTCCSHASQIRSVCLCHALRCTHCMPLNSFSPASHMFVTCISHVDYMLVATHSSHVYVHVIASANSTHSDMNAVMAVSRGKIHAQNRF